MNRNTRLRRPQDTKRRRSAGDPNRRRRAAQAAVEHVDVCPGAKVTYVLALTKYSNDQAGMCWPSQKTLAKDRGVSERTIVRHVKQLEAVGLWGVDRAPIVREADGTVHRERTNRYSFCVPKAVNKPRKPSSHRHDTGVAQNQQLTVVGDKSPARNINRPPRFTPRAGPSLVEQERMAATAVPEAQNWVAQMRKTLKR